jgi:hypothetical protein|tara:strand:- start:8819 stop:9391 length:573 start_codon:yes stop_codon:yes gene_type:complete
MVKLNIGPDTLTLPTAEGWENIDIRRINSNVIKWDIREGIWHRDNSVTEAYGGNFFDHLSPSEGEKFLRDIHRALVPNGTLSLSMMDLHKVLNTYLTGQMGKFDSIQPEQYQQTRHQSLKFSHFLLGNLGNGKEYMGHKAIYDFNGFQETAKNAGFPMIALLPTPLPKRSPWHLENPAYYSSCMYVECRK